MKTGRRSVAKGKNGMDEFAQLLDDHGIRAMRGHNTDCVHAIGGIHFEVKRQERCKPYEFLGQAMADALAGQIPIVAHRQNRREWIAILELGDLLEIVRRAGMISAARPV